MPQEKKEGIYIIRMRNVYRARHRRNRGQRAIRYVKDFLKRHLNGNIIIDPLVSTYIYSRKIEKPPRVIAVRFIKIDEGMYKVCLALPVKR